MHHITEDTPPDMLAGAMDLVVRLPDGRDVSMAVERSTPMMDLLVHLTTANKLRPSDHVLQALDMSRDRTLPYKPNTPIGALDTQRVRVIPKGPGKGLAPKVPTGQQPFESTFRLQVHLPRNQFCVIRVGKYVFLEDIMKKVCEEKNLDSKKYEFRHPANIDKVLDPKRTLNDYEITEITVVHKGSGHLSQALSTTDIMALQREEERRKLQSKTGGGVLNLIFKRGRNSMGSGSISSDTRSISPTQSDDSRSVTPPAIQNQAPIIKSTSKDSLAAAAARPKPPQRKRRPAPKPPSVTPSPENQHQSAPAPLQDVPKSLEAVEKCQQEETTLTICHSRNSSDSSGYHEASILSDNCNTTLPRRPKSTVIDSTSNLSDGICTESRQDFRKSTGNLSNMTQSKSTSTMSLNIAGRKKKPPPPPPSLSSANSAASINSSISTPPTSEIISEVVASKSNAISTNNIRLVDHKLQSDSIGPASPTDNSSLPRTSDTSLHAASLTSNRSSESASIHTNSSPTSNVGSPKKTSVSSLINSRDEVINREIKVVSEPVLQTVEKQESSGNINESSKRVVPPAPKRSSLTTLSSREDSVSTETIVQETVRPEEKEVIKEVKTVIHQVKSKEIVEVPKIEEKLPEETHNELESDWQYTLPSPPTAFRDSSPTNFTDVTNYDTVTFNGLTSDSIVTSPALFEKLESISNKRLATDEETISNVSRKTEDNFENHQSTEKTEENLVKLETHVKQPEEEVLTSKYLSLETLEKRKSLVLERELASLKMVQSESTVNSNNNEIKSQRDSLRNEIEEVIQNKSRSSTLSRQNSQSREKLLLSATDSTLPNFKITTYDQPKSKINIFEDDSIRSSNIELRSTNKHHSSSMEESNSNLMPKRNSLSSVSTENIYFAKRNSADDFLFKKPSEVPHRYIKKTIVNDENRNNQDSNTSTTDSISRSESFSAQKNAWSRANPVKRSKSHISLDKYKDDTVGNTEDGLHKSNSLYNVSGLQSLEVMRMILPKLGNTPPSSPSEDKKKNPLEEKIQVQPQTSYIPPKPEIPREPSTPKKYQYSGPPAINFATWGERPKTQISIKEDTDYKFSNIKSKFNNHSVSKQENVSSYNAVNIKVTSNDSRDQVDSGKINIKINSNDDVKTISQPSGNVVIKIGSNNNSGEIKNGEEKIRFNNPYTRFLNQTTAVGYRKPLGNINGVDKPRPHSIAFDASCPDLSRVPIVTGVELKKTYKESNNNKSITQILHDPPVHQNGNKTQDDDVTSPPRSNTLGNQYRHSSVYLSSENINKIDNQNGQSKGLSIAPLRNVSRGNSFVTRNNSNGLFNSGPVIKGFRESDIQKITSKSLDAPFSQSTLKRTDYSVKKPVSVPVEKSIFETVTLRKTSNFNRYSMPSMPVDNQHNSNTPTRNSVSAASVVENKSNGFHSNRNSSPSVSINNPPPPPPAPKMPKGMIAQKKPLQRQLPVEDPRDQLLESIRSFGGKSGLRANK